jgi:hypothetical protein
VIIMLKLFIENYTTTLLKAQLFATFVAPPHVTSLEIKVKHFVEVIPTSLNM